VTGRRPHAILLGLVLAACVEEPRPLARVEAGPPPPFFTPAAKKVDPVVLGDRLMAAGEPELALKSYGTALLEEFTPGALAGAGAASWHLGRLREALRFLEKAVELKPDFALAWNNLGIVRYDLGEFRAAREALKRAAELASNDPRIAENLGIVTTLVPEDVDLEQVRTEFRIVRGDDGRYHLVDQRPEPETP
jgi:tetratricopeptide (TPR) repeat protein